MIRKIAVLTSGGDAPGMNACVRAIVKLSMKKGIDVVGINNGFSGLINDDLHLLNRSSLNDILGKGGTILGSARLPEFSDVNVQKKAIEILKKHKIDALVVIGGDGSYRGALALHNLGFKTVALPGTIDNDIVGTDFTIGFDTALTTVVDAIDKLRDTSSSHYRCSVVEVMGNRCGDLTIYSGISCGAEILITNETGYDENEIIEKLNFLAHSSKKNHAIVVISEKITDVYKLAQIISENTPFSGRATVLGHVQRGGRPTPRDRILATLMGEKAVDLLIEDKSGECVCILNNNIESVSISNVLNKTKNKNKKILSLFENLV